MKIHKLFGSALMIGSLIFSATGCSSNEISKKDAQNKLERAAERTQTKFQEELNKDVFYFDFYLDASYEMNVSEIYGQIEKETKTGKVLSKEVVSVNMGSLSSIKANLYANFDSAFYKNLDTTNLENNTTAVFASIESIQKVSLAGEKEEINSKVAFDNRQN